MTDEERIGAIVETAVEVGALLRELPSGCDAICALEFVRMVLIQEAFEAGVSIGEVEEAKNLAKLLFASEKPDPIMGH